jgi:hypothetical protein
MEQKEEFLRQVDELLFAAARLSSLLPNAVLVGGTAAAVHAGHRLSLDNDFALHDLRDRYQEVLDRIEAQDDWQRARLTFPVVIFGNFHGVETTLRQLLRTKPLETTEIETPGGKLRIPTLEEMIRVKAWLALTRNAYRDYLDLAALSDLAGDEKTRGALAPFDEFYADVDAKGVVRGVSPLLQLSRQLYDPRPYDLTKISEMVRYKAVADRWNTPEAVLGKCKSLGFLVAGEVFSIDASLENELERLTTRPDDQSRQVSIPDHPEHTHKAFVSKDGGAVIIRKLDEGTGKYNKVDNPLGPAVVTRSEQRFSIDGRFMPEAEWQEAVARNGNDLALPRKS